MLVLRLSISPPDPDELGKNWVAREELRSSKIGEWVAELTQLVAKLVSNETEQRKKEALRQSEFNDVNELKEKLSKLSPVTTKKNPLFQRLWGRSGT